MEPGRESENLLREGQNPTTQTSEQSVSPSEIFYDCDIAIVQQYLEGSQNEGKSVCLSVVKTKCFVLAFIALVLVIIGICVPFISQGRLSGIRLVLVVRSVCMRKTVPEVLSMALGLRFRAVPKNEGTAFLHTDRPRPLIHFFFLLCFV